MSKKIQGQIRVEGELPPYIKGRISGIISGVMCNVNYIPYATVIYNGDTFFKVRCTEKQFDKICKLIEFHYSKIFEIKIVKI